MRSFVLTALSVGAGSRCLRDRKPPVARARATRPYHALLIRSLCLSKLTVGAFGKTPAATCLLLVAVLLCFVASPARADGNVTIVDRGTHYCVVLDLESGASHRQIGEQYGEKIREVVPQFEQLLDSYLAEHVNWLVYMVGMRRVRQMRPQIRREYRDEIEGIASALSGGNKNKAGDGKISVDELYMFNLLGDIARLNQCCAVSVFGESSASGATVVGRNFDWPDGRKNQLTQLQAVVTIKDGSRSLTNVACIGFQGAVSAFNTSRVFGSVLDSPTGAKYKASRKRSFLLDLRQALEESTSLDGVAAFMIDSSRKYAFNHLIMLADPLRGVIVENNISGKGPNMRRSLRTCSSPLRAGANWDVPAAIGAVNCFWLEGNDDNHIDPLDEKRKRKKGQPPPDINTPRWESIKEQLKLKGPKVTFDGIKGVLSYYHKESGGNVYRGDLYNSFTMQSVVFEPSSFLLEVAFRPRNGNRPAIPKFERIPVTIGPP